MNYIITTFINNRILAKMSITRNKLYNYIIASKIDIDYTNINHSCKKIKKQLSSTNLHLTYSPIIYHVDSFYRDNTNDKYELSKNNNKQVTSDLG
jgi:hypothetical protein